MSVNNVLVVGGSPERSSLELIATLVERSDAVVAVDRGLDYLLAAGCSCDLFCGDADSVGEKGAAAVRACEAGEKGPVRSVERYDPHKDFTDLALALRAIEERWPDTALTCTCLSGGRPDHALAVYGRLASWHAGTLELREDSFSSHVLRGPAELNLDGCRGMRFSFVALSEDAEVSERGMRWVLDHAHPAFLGDLGISNVIESDEAAFTCHAGTVATWLFA